jgi:hypothetical protein
MVCIAYSKEISNAMFKELSLSNVHLVRFPLKLMKIASMIQDFVSPHCCDQRMV